MKRFNLPNYGLTLVDAEGIVRGVDIRHRELERLMKELYPAAATDPPAQKTP